MFFIPRANVVESDEGYSVGVLKGGTLSYCEPTKCVNVDTEYALFSCEFGFTIFPWSIKAWSWTPEETIHKEGRGRIIENIRSALRFRDMDVDDLAELQGSHA